MMAFVLYMDRVNFTIAVTRLGAELALSQQAVANILSAFLFGYTLGLIPSGWLADRLGPYKTLKIAGISWAILTALVAAINTKFTGKFLNAGVTLFILRFLLGMAEACAFPTFACALANWMRRSERAMASGLIHMACNLGGVASPIAIAFVMGRLGWRYSFLFSGLVTFAVTLWWWLAAADTPSEHQRVSESELHFIASDNEGGRSEVADAAWYKRMAYSRNVYMLCLSEVFYGISGFVFVSWFYIYYTQVRGVGAMYSATLTSLTYIAGGAGALLGGILCDRALAKWGAPWGRRLVPLVAIVASGACCILAPALRNDTASGTVYAVAAGLQYLAAPAFWATVIDITRRGPGIVGGLMNGSGNLGAAVGTITFPWVVSHVGYQTALQAAGISGLLGGLVWLLIDSSREIDLKLSSVQNRQLEPVV
jgi:MFS transporter, ACS family, glucarate transporter